MSCKSVSSNRCRCHCSGVQSFSMVLRIPMHRAQFPDSMRGSRRSMSANRPVRIPSRRMGRFKPDECFSLSVFWNPIDAHRRDLNPTFPQPAHRICGTSGASANLSIRARRSRYQAGVSQCPVGLAPELSTPAVAISSHRLLNSRASVIWKVGLNENFLPSNGYICSRARVLCFRYMAQCVVRCVYDSKQEFEGQRCCRSP